jgi:hypothetical protein
VFIQVDACSERNVKHPFDGLDPILNLRSYKNCPFRQGMKALRCDDGEAARKGFEHHQRLTFNAGRQEQHGCCLEKFEFFLLVDPT